MSDQRDSSLSCWHRVSENVDHVEERYPGRCRRRENENAEPTRQGAGLGAVGVLKRSP